MDHQHTEIRRFPRIDSENVVRISLPNQADETLVTTRELGAGGCLLVNAEQMGAGRVMILTVSLGNHEVRTIAKVLYEYPWRDGLNNSGVEFLYVNEEDQRRLEQFIDQRLPRQDQRSTRQPLKEQTA